MLLVLLRPHTTLSIVSYGLRDPAQLDVWAQQVGPVISYVGQVSPGRNVDVSITEHVVSLAIDGISSRNPKSMTFHGGRAGAYFRRESRSPETHAK